ncbi:MAG TPA: trypsin-like peptidase domain-containing protein [Cytophagaceae bacterium]|jgi:Do/DeqQ family serine protease
MKKLVTYYRCLLIIVSLSVTNCSNDKTLEKVDTPNFAVQAVAVSNNPPNGSANEIGNFVSASKAVTPAVVHIKTVFESAGSSNDIFEQFYGRGQGASMGSGSGVIISENGYIATNNHVIENAAEIEVILPDKRVFKAKTVGTDPSTDLALLKINGNNLPTVRLGNSDQVQVGEWVLAVGYPFSLNTTVTAGIVSAKARSIGIIGQGGQDGSNGQAGSRAIESFIQTDAAINPGNSGGALVNTNGELIGINSAIASQTGSYAGYAFAIPVNLARKILDDLKNFGSVKRGVLGVLFPSPSLEGQYFKEQGLNPATVNGVYIIDVVEGSAADAAGLKEGDVIQSINGAQLSSSEEFSERIARHKPGDKLELTFRRKRDIKKTSVTLKSEKSSLATNKSVQKIHERLGASFGELTPKLKRQFDLNAGVVVTDVKRGGFFDQIGIPEGTIIAFINGQAISNPNQIDSAIMSARNGIVQVLAVAPDGSKTVFNFSIGT